MEKVEITQEQIEKATSNARQFFDRFNKELKYLKNKFPEKEIEEIKKNTLYGVADAIKDRINELEKFVEERKKQLICPHDNVFEHEYRTHNTWWETKCNDCGLKF